MSLDDEYDPIEEDHIISLDVEYDPRISKIYYYFEKFTTIASGRTAGRKIGVVQEIIVRKHLLQSPRLADAVLFEYQLPGFSGATHKVEFVFFQPIKAIEFTYGQSYKIGNHIFTLISTIDNQAKFRVQGNGKIFQSNFTLHYGPKNANVQKIVQQFGYWVKLSAVAAGKARLSILDIRNVRASVESKRVGAQRFSNSDTLGSGIQTIEKAKQAALVAIDADLKFNTVIKAYAATSSNTPRPYKSFVVLGNGVHWTTHDRQILGTYVDYTFLVPDSTILRYADFVQVLAEQADQPFFEFFMSYFQGMTKTLPDAFTVDSHDFQVVQPENETRPFIEIVENQINDYPVELASIVKQPPLLKF